MSKSNENKDKNLKKNNKNKKNQKAIDETLIDKENIEQFSSNNEKGKDPEELVQIKDQLLRTLAENENIRKKRL